MVHRKIFPARLVVNKDRIESIEKTNKKGGPYILPGLIDAHVHIESSMLSPGRFAQLALKHGTVATLSDPHEIANVLGRKGVDYMIEDGSKAPMKFFFGAPSCVPATNFEQSGATLGLKEVEDLLCRKDIPYLSEMMNFPGVIEEQKEIWGKINLAKKHHKPIDGHAPGLRGEDLRKYIGAGISTDHECTTLEEAEEKIKWGMKILIREGSAAKDFEALHTLVDRFPEQVMLCSDDLHPDDLLDGHMNKLLKRGLDKGLDIFNLLAALSLNPIRHYNINVGCLQVGDMADFILVDNLKELNILETWIEGKPVFKSGSNNFNYIPAPAINHFEAGEIKLDDLKVPYREGGMKVILAYDGELYTGEKLIQPGAENNLVVTDPERDIAKLVVLNRYHPAKPAIGFIKGFGIKKGSLASCIAHDSHNIIALGQSDQELLKVINLIIKNKGGVALSDGKTLHGMPLELAGIMTTGDPVLAANRYLELNNKARKLCMKMSNPFMTLAFMSLLVIPELKLSDRGLFSVRTFAPTSLFADNQ